MPAPVNLNATPEVDQRRLADCPPPDSPRMDWPAPGWRLLDRRLPGLRLVDCVWPSHCLACGEAGRNGRDLCTPCLSSLPRNLRACLRCALPLPDGDPPASLACQACLRSPPRLGETHAPFLYAAPFDRLLPRLKFHGDLAVGRLLAQLLVPSLAGVDRPQALVPVPLHPARLRARGYDQALELARPLARALRLPLHADGLRRVRATAPQSRLDAHQRRDNVSGAFAGGAGIGVLPAHVALVDDVMTTGATLDAAARVLLRNGVARVDAWTCARVR